MFNFVTRGKDKDNFHNNKINRDYFHEKIFFMIGRLNEFIKYLDVSVRNFEQKISASDGMIRRAINNNTDIQSKWIKNIADIYPQLNIEWLITGQGNMLNKTVPEKERKKIPVFDAESFAGVNERLVSVGEVSKASGWIDAGDWFMNATAAIRHYGNSMVEYPSGCILALREVFDWNLIVWGKNYVIETDEYRITKRLQCGDSDDYVMAYSTDDETYPDGTLIHQPVKIPLQSIRRLAVVLGYVVKEQSSGMVYNVRNKR